jgi:glutamate N-acetyltransferase / amino-acid N-acetyltransferase
MRMTVGGVEIFSVGVFRLNPLKESELVAHLRAAELYASAPPDKGVFAPPIDFPSHERCVEIDIDLRRPGGASAVVLGADLTHEYVSENADYRS